MYLAADGGKCRVTTLWFPCHAAQHLMWIILKFGSLGPTGTDFSSNRHLQPLLQGFVYFAENGTSEEKKCLPVCSLWDLKWWNSSPLSNFKWVWTNDWHQFSPQVWQLEINFCQKLAMDPRTLSQIPNHKSSPMLKGYDLDTKEKIQPVPSQSSHSRSATPASHQMQMCKCYFVASWLTASIALEKVLVPVTKPTGSTVLGVSQVSAQGK